MNKGFSVLLAGSCFAVGGCTSTAKQPQRPNVIYVFADQMRNPAMGFWQEEGFREAVGFRADPVHTPSLNGFAREALVLSSAQSNCPLSSPHRGMLLTGTYPHESGVPLNCNSTRPISSLRTDPVAIGDVMSRSGYDCAYIGKLHTDFPTPNDPERPGEYVEEKRPVWDAYTPPEARHGFNYWYSYGTFDVHKQPHYWDTGGKRHEVREWSPIHETDKALEYLRGAGSVRDKNKPFFMMVSYNPPHSPYGSLDDVMEEDYNLYRDIPLDSLLVRPNVDRTIEKAAAARYYFASVTGVDRQFGRILAELSRLGLDRNTVVVFSSDHGETMCSQGTDDPKNSPYAEAMNVPFLVRWPDHIAPRVDDLLLSTPDVMPTLLGLCGLRDSIPVTVRGRDFSRLFTGDRNTVSERPECALYIKNIDGERNEAGEVVSYIPVARGIKTARWTLALYIDPVTHALVDSKLYHDQSDPYQQYNLSPEKYPQLAGELYRQLAAELRRVGDPWYRDRILSEILPY